MGVYIPNMDKPKSCDACRILRAEFDFPYDKPITGCRQKMGEKTTLREEWDALMPDCPLIDIVTCGECKHLEVINKAPIYAHCHKWSYDFKLWQEDTRKSFCSYGERRADEEH